jgi:hypothetical protein
MFLIFGFRTRVKALARLLLICRACTRPASHAVYRKMRWFTLFFIPVIPLSRKHLLQCAMCGHVGAISKEDAERLVAQAQAEATVPADAVPAPTETEPAALEQ